MKWVSSRCWRTVSSHSSACPGRSLPVYRAASRSSCSRWPVAQLARPNALVRDLDVVAERGGLDSPVSADAALGRQHRRQDRVVQNRLAALLGAQGVDEREPLVLLGLQDARALVDARLGHDRLGAHEHGRDDDLIAEDEAVDDQVVAVDLPAPGLGLRWLPEHADEVHPLAVLGPAAGDLADRVVQPHDVARGAEAARAERLLDQAQCSLALLVGQVFQQHAVAHQERVDVPPPPPGV